jgi:hypothetical protein
MVNPRDEADRLRAAAQADADAESRRPRPPVRGDFVVVGQTIEGAAAAVVSLVLVGGPTGGTFTLRRPGGGTSAPIAWNAAAATIQAALVPLYGSGNVTCSGGPLPASAASISWGGTFLNVNVPSPVGDATGLTGGTPPREVRIRRVADAEPNYPTTAGGTYRIQAGVIGAGTLTVDGGSVTFAAAGPTIHAVNLGGAIPPIGTLVKCTKVRSAGYCFRW